MFYWIAHSFRTSLTIFLHVVMLCNGACYLSKMFKCIFLKYAIGPNNITNRKVSQAYKKSF